MADLGFELEEIARLIKLVETRRLVELVVEDQGRSVAIRGFGVADVAAVGPAPDIQPKGRADAPRTAAPPVDRSMLVPLASPMIGVFYRSAGPDQPPYVEIGDEIEAGQTIGMIEAMKVFSEIPAESAGIVEEIVAKDGELVQAGRPLMYLRED